MSIGQSLTYVDHSNHGLVEYDSLVSRAKNTVRSTNHFNASFKLVQWNKTVVSASDLIDIAAASCMRRSAWNKTN